MRPLFLGGSEDDLTAGLLLARSRQVGLPARRGSSRARLLADEGFTPVVGGLHCLHDTRADRLATLPRRSRKALQQSLDHWEREGLHLTLTAPRDFGIDRVVEEVYFPILVRQLYTLGRSPFGSHNLGQFTAMLAPGAVLGVVSQGGRTVGAAVLAERDLSGLRQPPGNPVTAGKALSGMVYALTTELAPANRAFLEILRQAAGYGGWECLSMGEDNGWVDRGYLPVISDKLRWADSVGVEVPDSELYLRLDPPALELPVADDPSAGLLLTWNAATDRIDVSSRGVPTDELDTFLTRLTRFSLPGGTPS